MYSKEQKAMLDLKVKEFIITPALCENAFINTKELMSAIKVAPSYKVIHENAHNEKVISYINERNYYGNRPYLNTNAIYLYIYLHFLNPSSDGKVVFNVKTASDFLNLSAKTIYRNLKVLLLHDYILYSKSEQGEYTILINNYNTKSLTVSNGNKGYITLSLNTFKELLSENTKANNINELRMQLRGLISCVPGLNQNVFSDISYKNIKKVLPSYVKIKDIKRMLVTNKLSNIFTISLFDKTCKIKAKDIYNPLVNKAEIVGKCKEQVEKLISKLNKKKEYKNNLLNISSKDIMDISNISLRLPIDDVLTGVSLLFEKYSNKQVASIGSLVRVLSEDINLSRLSVV